MKTMMMGVALAGLLVPAAARSADGPPADEKKPKVITEEELRRSRSGGTVSVGTPDAEPSPAAGAEKKDEAAKEPTEDERREGVRSQLQGEIDHHVKNIESLQKQVDDAQKELNDNTEAALSLPGTTSGRRGALLKLIDDANVMIQQSKDAIDQAEDKARREGIRVNRP